LCLDVGSNSDLECVLIFSQMSKEKHRERCKLSEVKLYALQFSCLASLDEIVLFFPQN
jgi:hypothetical protein